MEIEDENTLRLEFFIATIMDDDEIQQFSLNSLFHLLFVVCWRFDFFYY
jgi:hypothetical protein